jgi:hypothetical protein
MTARDRVRQLTEPAAPPSSTANASPNHAPRHVFNNLNPRPLNPRVSVCVITYNHGAFIRQCLDSLVSQDVDFPWEIIVSDDSSSDDAPRIIAEFEARFPHLVFSLRHDQRLGGAPNYRQLHLAARGELVAHIDGDDYWLPGKLAAQVAFLDRHPECAAVFTNADVVARDGRLTGRFSSGIPETFDASFLIRKGNFLTHSSMMYRAAYQPSMLPPVTEFIDLQLYIRLLRRGRFGYIDRRLATYRDQAAASATSASNDLIRTMYWQALQDIDEGQVTAGALRSAKARFLAGAMQRELTRGSLSGYSRWHAMVAQEPSGGADGLLRLHALGLTALHIVRRVAFKAAVALRLAKPESRVFHPR